MSSAPGGDYVTRHVTTLVLTGARFFVLLAALACGGSAAKPSAAEISPAPTTVLAPPGQLARFAALKVMVLPAQSVQADSLPAWRNTATVDKALLAALDSAVEGALNQRGMQTVWVYPAALQRSARRNPTYLTDPYLMQALDPVRQALKKPQDALSEPFASQLRALAGVNDSRYSLIPLVLRFEPSSSTAQGQAQARAVLRSVVVDARGAQVVWVGEVASEPQATFSAAILASLAQRVSDLVVPR